MTSAFQLLALPLLLLCCAGFTSRPDFIVRFFAEANEQDTERFASPIQLKYPPRSAFIERVPTISERNIKAIFPYPASDGTWGCAFKLDPSGRISLETASTTMRGRAMVAFVGTKKGTHQVIDMSIDQPIRDGIVTIQRGLTVLEISALTKRYPNLNGKRNAPQPPAAPSVAMPASNSPVN